MRDKNQQFIFNDEELSLIKNTFADDDTLLYTIRKVFLQFPLTDVEKGLIKTSITPEVFRVLKKKILPDISDEFPLGQLPDYVTTLTSDIKAKGVEEMAPLFASKKLQIDYLNQQFEVLKDLESEGTEAIKLSSLRDFKADALETYVKMTAYLFLLGYIDPMLIQIKHLAGEKKETLEEQKIRLDRNSTK